jgi:hypothetical protein
MPRAIPKSTYSKSISIASGNKPCIALNPDKMNMGKIIKYLAKQAKISFKTNFYRLF